MRRLPDEGFVLSFADVTREREATAVLAEAKETLEQRVRERTLELQEALKAQERSNASRTRIVAAVSHDLLQPLSAAKLYPGRCRGERNPTARDRQSRRGPGIRRGNDQRASGHFASRPARNN